MVPVPVTVRLVEVAVFHEEPDPAIDQVPEPTAIVLTEDNEEIKEDKDPLKDTLYMFALNVPLLTLRLLLHAKASCNVTLPFGLSTVVG